MPGPNELPSSTTVFACDRTGKASNFVTGRGPVTATQLRQCLPPVLAPRVLLVTDLAAAYQRCAKAAGIEHGAVNVVAGVRVVDDVIHVQTVNSYHGRFKGGCAASTALPADTCPTTWAGANALDAGRVRTPQRLPRAALFLLVI